MTSITVNGTTFIECTFEYEDTMVYGLYIHDVKDVNRNGDGVIGNVDIPKNEDDASAILFNETMLTDCDVLESVRFMDGSTPDDYVWD